MAIPQLITGPAVATLISTAQADAQTFQIVTKQTSEARTNNTQANDAELSCPGAVLGARYWVHGRIKYTADAAAKIAFRINAAHADADGIAWGLSPSIAANGANDAQPIKQQEIHAANATFGTFGGLGVSGTPITCIAIIEATVTMTDVGGSIALSWAQANTNAIATSVLLGSEWSIIRLPDLP